MPKDLMEKANQLGTVNFLKPDRKPTHDEIVRGIFGISLEQLIADIRLNNGGKYDSLYVNKGGS